MIIINRVNGYVPSLRVSPLHLISFGESTLQCLERRSRRRWESDTIKVTGFGDGGRLKLVEATVSKTHLSEPEERGPKSLLLLRRCFPPTTPLRETRLDGAGGRTPSHPVTGCSVGPPPGRRTTSVRRRACRPRLDLGKGLSFPFARRSVVRPRRTRNPSPARSLVSTGPTGTVPSSPGRLRRFRPTRPPRSGRPRPRAHCSGPPGGDRPRLPSGPRKDPGPPRRT